MDMRLDQVVAILPLHTDPKSDPMLLGFGIVSCVASLAYIVGGFDIFKLKKSIANQ